MGRGDAPEPDSQRLPTAVFATTAVTAVAPATARASFLRAGFIYVERSAIEFVAIERGDGLHTLAIVVHFDEGKASRLSAIAVGYDVHTVNRAIRLEQGAKRFFVRAETQVSHKYIFQVVFFPEFAERIGEQVRTVSAGLYEEPNSGLANFYPYDRTA